MDAVNDLLAVDDGTGSQGPPTVAGLRAQELGIRFRVFADAGVPVWLESLNPEKRNTATSAAKEAAVQLEADVLGSGNHALVGSWSQLMLNHFGETQDAGAKAAFDKALDALVELEGSAGSEQGY